jgi:NAD+ synthase (glutamine-hydrolysing)
MLRWVIDTGQFEPEVNEVLQSVLDTEISPELIPGEGDKPTSDTESKVGPYELQDFFLFYLLRFGYRPSKVAFMAEHAWGSKDRGPWLDLIPDAKRNEYSREDIKHWLEVFLDRFFRISQFKRTAIPNSPKVGSGGSLSPRGDWRAPSDSTGAAWLEELRRNVP